MFDLLFQRFADAYVCSFSAHALSLEHGFLSLWMNELDGGILICIGGKEFAHFGIIHEHIHDSRGGCNGPKLGCQFLLMATASAGVIQWLFIVILPLLAQFSSTIFKFHRLSVVVDGSLAEREEGYVHRHATALTAAMREIFKL